MTGDLTVLAQRLAASERMPTRMMALAFAAVGDNADAFAAMVLDILTHCGRRKLDIAEAIDRELKRERGGLDVC